MNIKCPECDGDGTELIGDGTHGGTEQQACSLCGGSGTVSRVVCADCLPIDQAAVGLIIMTGCHRCNEVRWVRPYLPRCGAMHPDRDIRCGLWHGHHPDHCRVLNRSGLLQDSTIPQFHVTASRPLDRVTWDARPHPLDRVLASEL